jgi:iron complex outermembrane receptor protein
MSRIAAAIAALAPAISAVATGETPAADLPRVIVTGSNIKRIDVETSDPVAIIRRADIDRSGSSTLAQFLQTLPWTTDSLTDTTGSMAFSAGGSSTSLRHLDKQSTLILLNGRRLAPFALADFHEYFTNIDTIPLAAVERIEVLKNGASAIYGSDAVAGVINVITRSDYRGFEAGADVQKSLTSHSFSESGIHVTAGMGDLKTDRFNVTAALQYYRRDRVVWRDVIDHTSQPWRNVLPQGADQLSIFSSPGNIESPSSAAHAVAGCDPASLSQGLCLYDRFKGLEAQPTADRTNLLVSAKAALTPEMEAFSELQWSRTTTSYLFTQPTYYSADSATSWGNPRTGATQSFYSFPLPPTHPLNDTGEYATLAYRFTDLDPIQTAASQNYRLVTGLRGSVHGVDWETALSLLGSTTHQLLRGPFSVRGFQQTIGGTTDTSNPASPVDPDFFNLPNGYRIGQQNSPEVLNALFPQLGYHGRLTQSAIDGKVSGDLVDLKAGPMSFAAGFDLRRERSVITGTDNVQDGDIVGYGSNRTDGARTYGAVFGELQIPVVKTLDAQLAARVDKFPGFGTHASPKIGLRYQPTKDLLLRATAEGGFRAPNLTEAARSHKTAFQAATDPKRCDGASLYADDLKAQAAALPDSDPGKAALLARADEVVRSECAAGITNVVSNNPALRPEVSRGYSMGLLFEPLPDTSFTLDYWKLDRKNEIGLRSTAQLLEQEGQLPPGLDVHRAPLASDSTFTTPDLQKTYGITSGPLLGVDNMFVNVSRTRTDGIDFGARTRMTTRAGSLELSVLGTWLNSFQTYSEARGGYGDNLAGRYGYSRWNATFTGALSTGPFLNGVKLTYRSGTTLQGDYYDTDWSPEGCAAGGLSARECRVAASITTDYFFSYSGVKNLTLSAYVGNVFNRRAPLDRRAIDTTPPAQDVMGRTLHVSVNYKFL